MERIFHYRVCISSIDHRSATFNIITMPFRAFYIDTGVEVSEQDLLAVGVERFQVDADRVDKEGTEPTLEKICIERNYNYKDVVSILLHFSI